jgi:PleD family two-component response regulator
MEKTKKASVDTLHILLIGNNPLEMSSLLNTLAQIRGSRIFTETAFDLKSIWTRLLSFRPQYILIDDNIGQRELVDTVYSLSKNRKTRNIPIAVLKNSNYQESVFSANVIDYVLKQSMTSESLYNTLCNSLKLQRAQEYLLNAYRRRTSLLTKLVSG